MCLSCNSKTAYFVFEGLILSSSVTTDLNISTPYSISIPDSLSIDFNLAQTYAKVKEGAKLFRVDVSKLDGEYFEFLGYSDAKSKDTEYAVITLDDKFSLLIKDGIVAIARNSDVLTPSFTVEEYSSNLYAVTNFKVYSLPVLQEQFAIDSAIAFGDSVEIFGKIKFNGVNFFAVKNQEISGFIPESFLTENIVIEVETTEISNLFVYKKGGVSVYDADGKVIGTLDKKTKVTVLKRGNTLTIIFGDGVGYIDSDCIVSSSSQDILKAVAIILAAFSGLITMLYFEFRYLFRKN